MNPLFQPSAALSTAAKVCYTSAMPTTAPTRPAAKTGPYAVTFADHQQLVRTHLANERTFLAWCRTSLAFTAFGFVLKKFYLIEGAMKLGGVVPHTMASLLGDFSLIIGILVMAVAGWRFAHVRWRVGDEFNLFPVLPDIALFVLIALMLLLTLGFAIHYIL